jgi:hypothetical protein
MRTGNCSPLPGRVLASRVNATNRSISWCRGRVRESLVAAELLAVA